MRIARRLAGPLAAATVALAALLAFRVLPTTRLLAIWVVLVAAIVLRELVRSVPKGNAGEPRFETALRGWEAAPTPSPFARMERDLDLASATADHAHRRLIPLLRAAATARLSTHHGIDLERRPDLARRLLGEKTWDLLRPDRPPPEDRRGPGPKREEIAAVIACLEEL